MDGPRRALGRARPASRAPAFGAAVGGAGVLQIPQAGPGLDHDVGDAVGERRVHALHQPARAIERPHGQVGIAVQLSRTGAALRAARHA
ncbi:hypothetical protein G6F65_022333 [Rhizopus arrhizus]|nr:hypothetical protein G6F31_018523 [Rhizopus arrhizus]KAG1243547.1 hypothetical protein G6F65_022333 [Rhizopus arrhizus]